MSSENRPQAKLVITHGSGQETELELTRDEVEGFMYGTQTYNTTTAHNEGEGLRLHSGMVSLRRKMRRAHQAIQGLVF